MPASYVSPLPRFLHDELVSKFGDSLDQIVASGYISRNMSHDFWVWEGDRLPELNFCRDLGVRLRFSKLANIPNDLPAAHLNLLVGYVFHCEKDFGSTGYKEPLPFGLYFGCTKQHILKCLPDAPRSTGIVENGGVAIGFEGSCAFLQWQFPSYSFHLLYLVESDKLIRVTSIYCG